MRELLGLDIFTVEHIWCCKRQLITLRCKFPHAFLLIRVTAISVWRRGLWPSRCDDPQGLIKISYRSIIVKERGARLTAVDISIAIIRIPFDEFIVVLDRLAVVAFCAQGLPAGAIIVVIGPLRDETIAEFDSQ